MVLRIAVLAFVITTLAGAFGVQRLLDRRDTPAGPASTASRRGTTAAEIQLVEQQVRDRPDDAAALTRLVSMYVNRARETGDPSFYGLADTAATKGMALAPDDVHVLVAAGTVALAKHDFEAALALGERARANNPDVVAVYGVITDALVELGRYDEATAMAQQMVDRRPDFASYSRVSYLRELHGDLDGAVEAMELAAVSAPTDFDEAWARVIIGNLHLQQGDIVAASHSFALAHQALPGDAMVLGAQARLAVARGDAPEAEALLRSAVEQRPLAEYAIALGEVLESQGHSAEAEEQYALVRAMQQVFAANGVDTDTELALFAADHGYDANATLDLAFAAHKRRPTIFAADAAAWAAYRAGRLDEARRFSIESLRLGTTDPRLLYHAGVIARSVGEIGQAETLLRAASAMEPAQSPGYASAVRNELNELESAASAAP